MRLLIDENVPNPVAAFLRARGHEVVYARDILPLGADDHVIATYGNEIEAVIVTWNHKHFKRLVSRATYQRYRQVGRISFLCKETIGRQRIAQCIDLIEAEYSLAQQRTDKRILVEIRVDGLFIAT